MWRTWTFVSVAAINLVACGPALSPLVVDVRDAATHEPAAGVIVVADVPNRDHPFSIASILGTTGAASSNATTNERGRVELKYIAGRPIRIGVLCAGWATGFILIEPDSPLFAYDAWLQSNEAPCSGDHQVEYRAVAQRRE